MITVTALIWCKDKKVTAVTVRKVMRLTAVT